MCVSNNLPDAEEVVRVNVLCIRTRNATGNCHRLTVGLRDRTKTLNNKQNYFHLDTCLYATSCTSQSLGSVRLSPSQHTRYLKGTA